MKTQFQKRHYEAIALAMQEAHAATNVGSFQGWGCAVDYLADLFARDNGLFNRDRFVAACQPGANVKLRTNYKIVA